MSTHEFLEQAAPYALDALDDAERSAFEAHLTTCDICGREVAELREVAGLLALAPRAVAAPASLRERIMREAKNVRPIGAGSQEAARSAASAQIVKENLARTAELRWRAARVIPWLALAASLVGIFVMRGRLQEERASRQQLAIITDSMRLTLASRDSLLTALLGPDVSTVKLTATGRPPSGRVYWNRQTSQVVFAAFELPPAPSGRTYQLWAIEGGNRPPVSLGTFNTGVTGQGRITATLPQGVRFAVGAVTEEPAGGSPQPTTQPFLVGAFGGGN